MPSANCGPGLPASPELTKLTAASGPAGLPSPIVCKDKRDADGPTLWQGRRPGRRQLTQAAQAAASWGSAPRGPSSCPGLGEAQWEAAQLSEASATSRGTVPLTPCPCLGLHPLATDE